MIYFDNASTTRIMESSRCVLIDALERYGNPSSPHGMGVEMNREIHEAARKIAVKLGCFPEEIIFTSGATESNNLAILGGLAKFKRRGGHILSTPLEHPSVLQPLHHLQSEGFNVTFAHPEEWDAYLNDETVMVSFSQVHNETGDLNDISTIAKRVKQKNPEIIVHVDGAQGFCKEAASFSCVDLYSFSAHKFHGPKGVGGLMVRKGVRIVPLMHGGGQQQGLRPGTENTSGILAMAAAAEAQWEKQVEHRTHVSDLYCLLSNLEKELPDCFINRRSDCYSPYILNMSFAGVNGETLVHTLTQERIYISMGAACRARKKDRSPLYSLPGMDDVRVKSAIRFSFSVENTIEEAETVKTVVIRCVNELRNRHATKGSY